MKWIRIGSRILNPLAIVEAIDRGECETKEGKQRVVALKLVGEKEPLLAAGSEADSIWLAITHDLEVWAETHVAPDLDITSTDD